MKEERQQTTIRLPADLMEWLQQKADSYGISINAMITVILSQEKEK